MAKYYLKTKYNGHMGLPITVALIRQDNVAMYLGFRESAELEIDPWVAKNVIPVMNSAPVSLRWRTITEVQEDFAKFFKDDDDITVVTDWPEDVVYFCRLLSTGPGEMINLPSFKFEVRRVEIYPTVVPNAVRHNAFWDAFALKAKVQPPVDGAGPAVYTGAQKQDFVSSVNTLAWEYVGDISQDIDYASYNEDSVRHYWKVNTLDDIIKDRIAEYPDQFKDWKWKREDGRYRDNLTALVIKHGGWPEDWGPYAAPLTDEEKQIVAKFVSENNIIYPAGEYFHMYRSTDKLTIRELLATYIFNLPPQVGLHVHIRKMWNDGMLSKILVDYQQVNPDFDFAQFPRYDGRYGDQLTYFARKAGGWFDGKEIVPFTDHEKAMIAAFNYNVVFDDKEPL